MSCSSFALAPGSPELPNSSSGLREDGRSLLCSRIKDRYRRTERKRNRESIDTISVAFLSLFSFCLVEGLSGWHYTDMDRWKECCEHRRRLIIQLMSMNRYFSLSTLDFETIPTKAAVLNGVCVCVYIHHILPRLLISVQKRPGILLAPLSFPCLLLLLSLC